MLSVTCVQRRVCAGAPLQRGSVGCSVALPSPPASSSHRSCPSGLLQHRAPWPCSSCSLSPESETQDHVYSTLNVYVCVIAAVKGRNNMFELMKCFFLTFFGNFRCVLCALLIVCTVCDCLPLTGRRYEDVEPSDEFAALSSCSSARRSLVLLSFCQLLLWLPKHTHTHTLH